MQNKNFHTYFILFMLAHKILVAIVVPLRMAFEDNPIISMVVLDFYLDVVFFIEIIMTFNTPIYDKNSK